MRRRPGLTGEKDDLGRAGRDDGTTRVGALTATHRLRAAHSALRRREPVNITAKDVTITR